MAGLAIRVAGTLIACFVFQNVVAVAVAETVALLTPAIASLVLSVRLGVAPFSPKDVSRRWLRALSAYGVRAFAVGALGAIVLQADVFIVGIVAPAAAITYYVATLRIYSGVRQILGWISEPMLPTLSRQYSVDVERGRSLVIGIQFLTLLVATGACVPLFLASPALVPFWLGADAPSSTLVAVIGILLFGLLINSTHIPAIPAADALGRPGSFFRLHSLWCVSNIVLSLILGSRFGLVGIALGTALPLLVLEPFYLRRIGSVLGIAPRVWAREVLRPTVNIAGPAVLSTGVALAATRLAGAQTGESQLAGGAVFAFAFAASTYLGLRKSSLGRDLRQLLRASV
jgi:O-antigen/teichoic acid export membrane protein